MNLGIDIDTISGIVITGERRATFFLLYFCHARSKNWFKLFSLL